MYYSIFAIFALIACTAAVTNPSQATLDENDNKVLRFALTLENLDSTFYTYFQSVFNRTSFIEAGYAGSVWDNLEVLAAQERAHVQILQDTLLARTGTTLPACEYNFSTVQSVSNYVGGGRLFENVGTAAYDGSIGSIYNKSLQQSAATIATVEARHAAFLNQLPGTIALPSPFPSATSPFPNVTDNAYTPMTVADYILPFIVSCPYNITAIAFPNVYVVVPVAAANTSVPANPTDQQVGANDLNALNYALSLELLEATYYNTFLPTYSVADFNAINLTADDYSYFQMILAHENAHVTALTNIITARRGTPAPNCTYNFPGVTDIYSFIETARTLEATGVSAYDGSVNTINDVLLRQAAATIATVEARHSTYLNQVTNTSLYPNATDTPLTPEQVITAVTTNYISSCNGYVITPPQIVTIYPYSNDTVSTTGSTTGTVSTTAAVTGVSTTRASTTVGVTTASTTSRVTTTSTGASVGVAATVVFGVLALYL